MEGSRVRLALLANTNTANSGPLLALLSTNRISRAGQRVVEARAHKATTGLRRLKTRAVVASSSISTGTGEEEGNH